MLNHQWKRWVAEKKLLNVSDQEIVGTLVKNGFDEQVARDELDAVSAHPYFQAAQSCLQTARNVKQTSAQKTSVVAAELSVDTLRSHPRVPERWMMWIRNSIDQKWDIGSIIQGLEKGGFSRSEIQTVLGANYPEDYLSPLKILEVLPGVDYQAVANVPSARLERLPGGQRIESPHLQLFTIDQFLTEKECDELVALINSNHRPSAVTNYVEGYRTSTTCELRNMDHPLVAEIEQKMSMAMGLQLAYSDGIEGQKYLVGQEFREHNDFFEPETEDFRRFALTQGNRTWTLMIYLNDVPKGGATRFVTLDKTITPQKGKAVVWNNRYPDGRLNRDTKHWGMPVVGGEKYIITKWFRDKGPGPMFHE